MATSLPRFLQLPLEIREEIWTHCLPHRVCEIDFLQDFCGAFDDDPDAPIPCDLYHTTLVNKSPPLITRVCRESRRVAFRSGGISDEPRPDGADYTCTAFIAQELDDWWQDKERDIAHSNWTPMTDASCGGDMEPQNPVPCLVWEASQLSGPASLMVSVLHQNFALPHSLDYSPSYYRTRSFSDPLPRQQLEAIKKLSTCLVVMRIIIVHANFKVAAATGLFGLAGDARVQIVDVADEARVTDLFKLAETSENRGPVKVAQDFRRDGVWAVERMDERLKDCVKELFGNQDLTVALRPAIMFRLCTQECNS